MPEARSALERAAEALASKPTLEAELRGVASFLAELEGRLGVLGAPGAPTTAAEAAQAELAVLSRETEADAEAIMTAAEAMLAQSRQDAAGLQAVVRQEAVVIIQACGFQDITGQRVSKVSRMLRDLHTDLAEVAKLGPFEPSPREESAEDRRARELILHGPATDGPEMSQDDVDALFP